MSRKVDSCPVCDMEVKYAEYVCQYNTLYYHFCSKQCLDNFNERPNLYIKASIKSAGELTKKRNITLNEPLAESSAEIVKSVLLALMGVNDVIISEANIQVTYDLKQITERQIEEILSEIEVAIKNNWFDRLRRYLIQQNETNELDNLAAPASPCCNKAPPH